MSDRTCLARKANSAERCNLDRDGASRWCREHHELWHGPETDAPLWDSTRTVTTLEADPRCPAWVKGTGKRCTNQSKPDSCYCGKHFNSWYTKVPPLWRPCPSEPERDPALCQATVGNTGDPCPHKHKPDSRWCGKHFNRYHGAP